MPLSFACMSHFSFKLFFNYKILLTFISIVIHGHLVKKSHNQSSNTCGVFSRILISVLTGVCHLLTARGITEL